MDGSQKTNEEVPSDLVSILKEPPQTEQPAIDKESSLGALEIAARKAADTISFNAARHAIAGYNAIADKGGIPSADEYWQSYARQKQREKVLEEAHPVAAGTGEAAGVIGSLFTPMGILGDIAAAGKLGSAAVAGGLSGLSSYIDDQNVTNALANTVLGGALGAALHPVSKAIAARLSKTPNVFDPNTGELTAEARDVFRQAFGDKITEEDIKNIAPQLLATIKQKGLTPASAREALLRSQQIAPTREMVTGELAAPLTAPQAQAMRTAARESAQQSGQALAQEQMVAPDVHSAVGLEPKDNFIGAASSKAHNEFLDQHAFDYKNYKDAWEHPAIAEATYRPNKVNELISKGLTPAQRQNLPSSVQTYLETFAKAGPEGIPLQDLQDARSLASRLSANPNTQDVAGVGKLNEIIKNILVDKNSISPKFLSGDTGYKDVGNIWQNAFNAAKKYKQTYGDVLEPFTAAHPEGAPSQGPVVPPEQFLDSLLGPKKTALANYQKLISVPGINKDTINSAVGDWFLSKMLNNGSKTELTSKDVGKFSSEPGYKEIMNSIPDFSQRIEQGLAQTRAKQLADIFNVRENNLPDLSKIPKNIDSMLAEGSAFDQEAESRLRLLSQAIRIINEKPISQSAKRSLVSGFLGKHGLAMLAGIAGLGGGYLHGEAGLGALGAAGAAGLGELSQRAYTAAQEAVERAGAPAFVGPLIPGRAAGAAGRLSSPGMLGFETPEERPERASGGRVMNHAAAADRLIAAAERAKKSQNKTTEPLLNHSDDAIATALAVANKHI